MPTLASERAPERRNALQILQRLDWQVIRRLDGILQGDYRSLFYGAGLDLADLREYHPGDDVRHIDWNVTARLDTPYVRQYIEDRDLTAWFLLDLSPSMDFGSAGPGGVDALKRDRLVEITTVLARLLTRRGNRVGAILYDSRVERVIPARGGRMHVLRLLNDLLKQPPLPQAPYTDLRVLLQAALSAIRRRSLIFVLSDFFTAPGWEGPLRLLARRHEVLAVRLSDPREQDIPDVGMVLMQDSETGEQLFVDTGDPGFRQRYREAAQRRRAALDTALRHARVDTLSLSTEDDLVRALVAFAAQRKQRRRARGALHDG